MEKAIIIVSYGSTKAQARQKSIEPFYTLFKNTYTTAKVVQAYTSRFVRKRLLEENIKIDSPKEAIEALIEEGYKKIYLQPTHILPGHEYHRIIEAVENIQEEHRKVQIYIGKALLDPKNDMKAILEILKNYYGFNRNKTKYVLLGHGTDHLAHQQYEQFEQIAASQKYPVLVGTIEDGVDEVIQRLNVATTHNVELIPLLFVAGDHVMNDMMGKTNSWMTSIQAHGFEVKCHPVGLGEIGAIREYYLKQFENIFQQDKE